MTPLHGEYRVRAHPDLPGRLLVTWRPDGAATWLVVDETIPDGDLHAVSDAMVHHRDHGAHQ